MSLILAADRLDQGEGPELWMLPAASLRGAVLHPMHLREEERRRAAAISRPLDRISYVASHLLLTELLSRRIGRPVESISYRREPCPVCGSDQGRPSLESAQAQFSLARRSGTALIGISSAPIGVDLEEPPGDDLAVGLAGDLHPDETAEIMATPEEHRATALTRLWVRKEAYLKGRGCGIAHGLDADYVGAGERPVAPDGWRITDVKVTPGLFAAVATLEP